MENKVVVITGASSGIGEATALHFADIGYKKFAFVARKEEKLQEIADKCKLKGAEKVLIISKDLYEPCKVSSQIIECVIEEYGRLDVFFSNAGISFSTNRGRDITDDELYQTMNLNFMASVLLTKYALPHLEKTKGTIIYTSSIFCK